MRHGLPVVSIVGRPNTGKSSLFNLLVGERKSIVDEMEGVTRDINIGEVKTPHVRFYLYDTAGYLEKGDTFNELVKQKVRQALEDTDLVVFVVDGHNFHPFDEDLALFLKKQKKQVLVVTNKLDNREQEALHSEFYNLGFAEIIPFSVIHKRGYATLLEKIEDVLLSMEQQPDTVPAADKEIRIALVGKPNVGKSAMLNRILGYDRSIVSPIPGTTRDSLDDVFIYEGRTIRLIDTAGLRRKAKIEEDIEYYSNVRTVQAIERAHVVIQLIDASDEYSMQDKRITEMVMQKGRGMIIAVNKWDLLKKNTDENHKLMEDFKKKVYNENPEYPFIPVEIVSAQDGYRVQKLLDLAVKVFDEYHFRVSTSALNEWVADTLKESYERKRVSNLRVYFCTQVHVAPPRFVFVINKKDHLRKDYGRFIENRLRLAFEFTGVPMKITFREKNAGREDEE